jgi:two-component system, chemotaxis family, protein-glutamate methylesterase/glutaminase
MGYSLLTIGCSWGGLQAMNTIFESLPDDIDIPIVIAQHRMAQSADGLTLALQKRTALPISDANDKDPIEKGHIYFAPPDYHLLVEPGSFALSTDEVVQFARPSIDVLFESAADSYADKLIAVILTGANEDGAAGLARVKSRGGLTIVQDPSTAVRPEMPQAAIAAARPQRVLPLDAIGPFLGEILPRRRSSTGASR